MSQDNSVHEYQELEEKYERVIAIASRTDVLHITDLRRALDDIYNAGREKGPEIRHTRRPLEYEINDNIVLITDGGMSEKGARQHTDALVAAATKRGYDIGYSEAKRRVLAALTGQEA